MCKHLGLSVRLYVIFYNLWLTNVTNVCKDIYCELFELTQRANGLRSRIKVHFYSGAEDVSVRIYKQSSVYWNLEVCTHTHNRAWHVWVSVLQMELVVQNMNISICQIPYLGHKVRNVSKSDFEEMFWGNCVFVVGDLFLLLSRLAGSQFPCPWTFSSPSNIRRAREMKRGGGGVNDVQYIRNRQVVFQATDRAPSADTLVSY